MISLQGDRVSLRPLQPDELETVWDELSVLKQLGATITPPA